MRYLKLGSAAWSISGLRYTMLWLVYTAGACLFLSSITNSQRCGSKCIKHLMYTFATFQAPQPAMFPTLPLPPIVPAPQVAPRPLTVPAPTRKRAVKVPKLPEAPQPIFSRELKRVPKKPELYIHRERNGGETTFKRGTINQQVSTNTGPRSAA